MAFEPKRCRYVADLKYVPEMCEEVIEHFLDGMTITQAAATLGVSRQTLNNWRVQYPEFGESVAYGLAVSQGLKERVADLGAKGEIENFNASMHKFLMAAQFKETYGSVDTTVVNMENVTSAIEKAIDRYRENAEKDY